MYQKVLEEIVKVATRWPEGTVIKIPGILPALANMPIVSRVNTKKEVTALVDP